MKYLNIYTYWKKHIVSSLFVLLASLDTSAQIDTIKWINKNTQELHSNAPTDHSDLHFLKKELKGKQIVALGEASHGTHEFYTEKNRIISYLIKNCGFRLLAFEVPDSVMMQINSFVQGGDGDLRQVLQGMGLYGTQEIYDLFLQLRDHNKNNKPENRVTLTGFDKPDYWADPISRDGFMAENVIKMASDNKDKIILWAHNVHVMKDTTAKYLSMGGFLTKHFKSGYYALMLDTYKGSVNVLNQRKFEAHPFQTNDNTLSGTLSKAQSDHFYLKFDAERDPFKGALSLITNIYSNWQEPKPIPVRPGIDFDAVLFIKNTTPSIELR